MCNRSAARAAFTLVELLTVIAVIGILAALIFPAISKMREQADITTCASNLRTLVEASFTYASDHEMRMVPPIENGADGFRQWMFNSDYLRALNVEPTTDLSKLPSFFLCPTAIKGKNHVGIHYGQNISGLKIGPNNFNQPGFLPNTKLISRPSQKIFLIDGLDWWIDGSNAGNYGGDESPIVQTPAYRHNGKANVAFYDGHVEMISGADLQAKQTLWDIPAN